MGWCVEGRGGNKNPKILTKRLPVANTVDNLYVNPLTMEFIYLTQFVECAEPLMRPPAIGLPQSKGKNKMLTSRPPIAITVPSGRFRAVQQ